jgi:hypothetical protein
MKFTIFLLLITFNLFGTDFSEIVASYQADKGALQRKYPNSLSDIYFERFTKF